MNPLKILLAPIKEGDDIENHIILGLIAVLIMGAIILVGALSWEGYKAKQRAELQISQQREAVQLNKTGRRM